MNRWTFLVGISKLDATLNRTRFFFDEEVDGTFNRRSFVSMGKSMEDSHRNFKNRWKFESGKFFVDFQSKFVSFSSMENRWNFVIGSKKIDGTLNRRSFFSMGDHNSCV